MRVAIIGTCASGKTTVVAALRERGVDAYAVAQEHSAIPALWRHLDPDRTVVLDADLPTVRKRRNDDRWPEWIYDLQRVRLADARAHADMIVETDALDVDQIAERIIAGLGIDVTR